MKSIATSTLISTAILSAQIDAFSLSSPMNLGVGFSKMQRIPQASQLQQTSGSTNDQDDEIERLRSMAAKLRADAAALEVCSNMFLLIFFSML